MGSGALIGNERPWEQGIAVRKRELQYNYVLVKRRQSITKLPKKEIH